MKQRLLITSLFIFVIVISIIVTIAPTFFTKGISRVVLKQDINLDLVLDETKDIEFVFFGYAGCADVCTPRLQHLGAWFALLSPKIQKRVGLNFLDLSLPLDKDLPHLFAQSFHKSFRGVFLGEDVLRTYTKAFSVYFANSIFEAGEMDHTTNLYLLKRDVKGKKIRFIYTAYPYDFKQITLDLQELLDE